MKKGFKKFLASSVTAVAALCLSLGITSSIYAADGDAFTILPADFYEGQTAGYSVGKVSPTTTEITKEGASVVLKSGTNYYGIVNSDSYATSKSKSLSNSTDLVIDDSTEEICFGGGRTITITPVADGTITAYWYDGGSKSMTVGTNGPIDATNYTVTSASDTCTANTEFVVNCADSNITMLAITFTPGSSSEGGDGESTESTEGTTETTTEAAARAIITDKATLTVGEADATATLDNDTVYGTYFTLMNGMSIDANSKTVDGLASYSYRMKSNGKTSLTNGVPNKRAIVFETAGAATLQVVGMSGSSSAERDYSVYSSDGTILKTVTVAGDQAYVSDIITLPSADTYYIACESAACNFYSINVVVGGLESVDYGHLYYDTTDAYMIGCVNKAYLSNDTFVIEANGSSVETDTVYAAALIDGNLITAESLGYDYIYVVKATNAVTNNNLDAAKAFVAQ